MSAGSPSMIERREYKLLVDRATAAAVRAAIAPFCRLDPYAARSPTRAYAIESLYLDTPDLALYWANDHEQLDRVKMRIRRYPDAPSGPVFFEVKRRVNDLIAKSRGRVAADAWARLLADPSAPIPDAVTGRDRAAVERFLALARTLHVRPVTVVRYQREPYVSTIDDYARVTFDTRIEAQRVDEPVLALPPDRWRALDDAVMQRCPDPRSHVVLELKFTNLVPLWLVNVVRRLGLSRAAFSKYGSSIRALHAVPERRAARLAGGWR